MPSQIHKIDTTGGDPLCIFAPTVPDSEKSKTWGPVTCGECLKHKPYTEWTPFRRAFGDELTDD